MSVSCGRDSIVPHLGDMTIYLIGIYIFSFGASEVLISSAVTGSVYSRGGGAKKVLFVSVKSIPLRIILFLAGAALFTGSVRDVIYRIPK